MFNPFSSFFMSKIHLSLNGEISNPYCFEIVYPDSRVLRYFVPAGQESSIPIEGGCFVRFSIIPLDVLKHDENYS